MSSSFYNSDWTIKQNIFQNSFTGTVVGIDDPLKSNRAQIRIPYLHEGIPDEYLPFFKNGNIQGNVDGSESSSIEIKIPVIGSSVLVKFENGDFYNGTFYGGYKNSTKNDDNFLENYGTFDGWKDQWGNQYKRFSNGNIQLTTNQGVTFNVSGTKLTVSGITETEYNSDKVVFNCSNSFTINSPIITNNGDTTITGSATIDSDTLTMGGKNINSSHRHGNGNDGNPTTGVL